MHGYEGKFGPGCLIVIIDGPGCGCMGLARLSDCSLGKK